MGITAAAGARLGTGLTRARVGARGVHLHLLLTLRPAVFTHLPVVGVRRAQGVRERWAVGMIEAAQRVVERVDRLGAQRLVGVWSLWHSKVVAATLRKGGREGQEGEVKGDVRVRSG